jgi:hypothetical protein
MSTMQALTFEPSTSPAANRRNPGGDLAIAAMNKVLQQLAGLLDAMSDEQYATKAEGAANSSIGGHVRHCLDHVDALLKGIHTGVIDYDRRQRGTDIETRRLLAVEATRSYDQRLGRLVCVAFDTPLCLVTTVSSAMPAVQVQTSVGRELAFVLSHTVHHNALIAVIASMMGIAVPERFGYAPSTIAHLENSACAR